MDDERAPPPAYSEQEFEQKTIDALRESQLLAPPANQDVELEGHDGRAFEIASNRSRASSDGLAALYSLGIRNGRPVSTGIQSRPRGQTDYSNRSLLPPVEPLRIQKRGNPPSKGQNWSKPPPGWISPPDAGGSRRLDVEGNYRSVSPYNGNTPARQDIYANDEFLPLFFADSQLGQLDNSAPNYLSLPAVTSPSHIQPSSFRPSHYAYQNHEPPLRPQSSMDDQYRSSRQSLPVTPRTPDYQVTQRPQTMSPSFAPPSLPSPPPHRLDFNPAVAYRKPDRLELSTPSRPGAFSAAAFYNSAVSSQLTSPPAVTRAHSSPYDSSDQTSQQTTPLSSQRSASQSSRQPDSYMARSPPTHKQSTIIDHPRDQISREPFLSNGQTMTPNRDSFFQNRPLGPSRDQIIPRTPHSSNGQTMTPRRDSYFENLASATHFPRSPLPQVPQSRCETGQWATSEAQLNNNFNL